MRVRFETFCRPWLNKAAKRLIRWDHHPELNDALIVRLSEVAARVLALELRKCKEAGVLGGSTPSERWRDFADRILMLPAMQVHLQTTYPLLFPLLDKVTDQFCQNLEEGLSRLENHIQGSTLRLSRMETGLSDPHAQGRSVICFHFHNGKKLIYKPRSVRGEVWWANFVSWWNASGVDASMELWAPEIADYDTYGWSAFIETQKDDGNASPYFFRLGVHIAITWLFGIGDGHFGNFVPSGSQPVFVDVECLTSAFWHPRLPSLPADLPLLFTPAWKTPLTAGMLPLWMMPKIAGQPLYLAPGMGGTGDRPLPVKRPVWYGIETDALHMELTFGLLPTARERAGTSTSDREIAEGFRVAANHLLLHRNEILQWIGSGKSQDPLRVRPRILLRNTTSYQQILEAATGAKYLSSVENQQAALQTISKLPVIGEFESEAFLDEELSYLNDQTYPRFVVQSDGSHIISDHLCTPVLECSFEASKTLALRQWQDLSEAQIDWYSKLISAACRQGAETRILSFHGPHRFLLAAEEMGRALERQAIHTAEGACWLNLALDAKGNIATQTPSGDFASGSAGIAVFLAQLGEATGDKKWKDLAWEAMRFSDHYWRLAFRFDGKVPWSIAYGAGSLLFAAGMATSLLTHSSAHQILIGWLERAERDRSWLDLNGDFLSGLPGWTVALAGISSTFPLARKLLDSTLTRLWEPSISASLTTPGLAHGTSGWVMSVIKAASALGNDRILNDLWKVIEALPNQWAQFEKRPSVQKDPPGGWCNGVIGLMAVAAEHPAGHAYVDAFFEKARPWFAGGHGGHHFCCGEAGRVHLLSRTACLLSDSKFALEAQRCADAILDHMEKFGFLHFHGIPERLTVPGWLSGFSGVGSAMLAAHALQDRFSPT